MEVLRRPQVLEVIGLSRQTLYRLIAKDEFPRPIQLGPQAVGWLRSEVEEWIKSRPRADQLST